MGCPICGKDLPYRTSKFCSIKCRDESTRRKNVEKSKEKFKDASEDDYVICKICGMYSANLNSHLLRTHDILPTVYKEKYGGEICSKTYSNNCSEKIKGELNPGFNHQGKLSPFSKSFIKGDISEETHKKAANSRKENCGYTNRTDYYTSRGYSEEEAIKMVSLRQTTFSKEICIEKYGEEEGIKRWTERQLKWFNSLSNDSYNSIEITPEIIENLKNSKDFQSYSWEIKRKSDKTYEKFKHIIDPNNLREKEGYELDHKFSKFEGFINGVDTDIMSSINNLQVLTREENFSKTGLSSITLAELLKS